MPPTTPYPAPTQPPSAADPVTSLAPSRPFPLLALQRTYLDAHRALASAIRRMVSAPLGLAWRLDIDVDVSMEVDAADATAARTLAEQILRHRDATVTVARADRYPNPPWRDLSTARPVWPRDTRVERIGSDTWWSVTATVSVSVTVTAAEADWQDYLDVAITAGDSHPRVERVHAGTPVQTRRRAVPSGRTARGR